MSPDRRHILKLLPSAGIAVLTGCDESPEDRASRMQSAMDNAKITQRINANYARPEDSTPKTQLTEDEAAANDPTKKLVLLCAADLSDPFQRLQADLMRSAIRMIEGTRFKVLDAKGDFGTQLDQLRDAPQDKPAWLIIQPLDERLTSAMLETLRHSGTRIIGLDQRLSNDSCDTTIFVDQHKLGSMAGQIVLDALRRKAKDEGKPTVTGRVVQIRGTEGSFASNARSEAFLETLHAEPGIIVVHDAPGNWKSENAKGVTDDALRLQHQFDVVFAHNDAMARGASDALNSAQVRDNTLIVGIDGIIGVDGGIDFVRRSIIDATIRQPMPMETAFLLIQKTEKEGTFQAPPRQEREAKAITPRSLEDKEPKAEK